ncbi:hypothetical protein ACNAN0_11265 [Agrilactobacillus fermenti]|uniref:hypothetical protein n=1 Tax=Agrilactobacillus fermenti TaxID=2586909 RepID=UPI003A5BD2C2
MAEDKTTDLMNFQPKPLLFSASLADALGVNLSATQADGMPDYSRQPLIPHPTIPIAHQEQTVSDPKLEAAKAAYQQAQQRTKLTQLALQQDQQQNQQQRQAVTEYQQQLTAGLAQAQQQAAALEKHYQELTAQRQKLVQNKATQLTANQQTNADLQQRVNTASAELRRLQDNVAVGTDQAAAQTQATQAYYAQELQNGQQQLQQSLQRQNDIEQSFDQQLSEIQSQIEQITLQLNARQNESLIFQAKLADLAVSSQTVTAAEKKTTAKVQAAIDAEAKAFDTLMALKRQRSGLSEAQQHAIASVPQASEIEQGPLQYVAVTRFQSAGYQALRQANTASSTSIYFLPPTAIAGFALDLDQSLLITDREVVGSLRELLADVGTADPIEAVDTLNRAPTNGNGRSHRALLTYVYQRQLTLITKYQTTEARSVYQLASTKIATDPKHDRFSYPKSFREYRVNWQQSQLTLDDDPANYLPSYLAGANGNGIQALEDINEDIARGRLLARKITLTYEFAPVQERIYRDEKSASADSKQSPTTTKKLFGNTNTQQSQTTATDQLNSLLGTYGIVKIKRGGYLDSHIMPRKY